MNKHAKQKPLLEIEQTVADLYRQIDELLTGFIPEVEAARRIKISRQAVFKRRPSVKRAMGGIDTPAGWYYREDLLEKYAEEGANRPLAV